MDITHLKNASKIVNSPTPSSHGLSTLLFFVVKHRCAKFAATYHHSVPIQCLTLLSTTIFIIQVTVISCKYNFTSVVKKQKLCQIRGLQIRDFP